MLKRPTPRLRSLGLSHEVESGRKRRDSVVKARGEEPVVPARETIVWEDRACRHRL
jgi:hypothetical protein